MTVMQGESTTRERQPKAVADMSRREIVAEMRLTIARLQANLARAEAERLREQLAWERAYRRRGLLGRLF
jgi:uncharacterized small protein (DUF1192 family)